MAEKKDVPKKIPVYMNFVIGGLSGMLAICIVQPMDLAKTRMQLMGPAGKNLSFGGVMKGILKKEGVRGFYCGLTAALFRQATYSTSRLGGFYAMLDWHSTTYGVPPIFPLKLLMGMASGGIGAFFGTPAEVALIRMTADGSLPPEKRWKYKHVFNALSRISREEGITTLWRGTSATITRAMVVNGAELGIYAQAREFLLPTFGDSIVLHFAASMIAGFFTSVVSLPVDIVKTRVQNTVGQKNASQVGIVFNIIKNEGIMTFWSGFLPTYAKIGPHAVFTFIFMEQLNLMYLKYCA